MNARSAMLATRAGWFLGDVVSLELLRPGGPIICYVCSYHLTRCFSQRLVVPARSNAADRCCIPPVAPPLHHERLTRTISNGLRRHSTGATDANASLRGVSACGRFAPSPALPAIPLGAAPWAAGRFSV